MLRALISLAVLVSAIAGPAAAGDLLIRNAALATADREKPLRGAWVLVEDGVVAEIGTGKAPAASAVIDARGKWVTPGLIDSHVHVWGDGGIREDSAEENPALLETFHAQEPRSFLYFGFTTLIDLKKSRGAVDRWNRQATAPALFACRDAPFANGYGMGFEPPEVRFENHPFYYADPAKTALLPPGDDPAEHTPEAVVAAVAADGDAICIKTFHERGFSGLFNFEAPDAALEARIERAARRAGLVHVLHATSLDSWDVGARAEAGVMAHGLWHWEELAPRGVKTLPDEIASMLDIMIRNGTAFQLTARILQGEIDHYRPEFLQDPRLAAALPPGVLAYYAGPDGAWFRDALEARIAKAPGLLERFLGRAPTGETAETSKTALVRLRLQAAYLRQHSGLILFGTDTPSSPGYGNPPGLNGRLEMDALAAMGFTPREILRAETLDNARVFNLAGRGCLDAGCRADLLILGANPLESVDAFDRIEAVILGGRPMARESLAASRLTKK